MLVLQRCVDEKIFINGHEIIITVVAIRGSVVRLGIEAPRGMSVHRGEVQQKIDAENGRDGGDPSASPGGNDR